MNVVFKLLEHNCRLIKILYIVLLASFLVTALIGCAGKGNSIEQLVSLNIKSTPNANLGEPFYIAIYSTNREQFLTTSYFDVTSKIFKTNQNKKLLSFQLILPGENKNISIYTQRDNSLGIYALFTHPSDQWKVLLVKPLQEKYNIILEKNSIVLKTEKKHWWDKIF